MRLFLLFPISILACTDNKLVPCSQDLGVEILFPADQHVASQGSLLLVESVLNDPCGRSLSDAYIQLTSDIDGDLEITTEEGAASWEIRTTDTLTLGAHTLTLKVTNSMGNTGEDELAIVVSPNEAPTIELLSPNEEDAIFLRSDGAEIIAQITDPEEYLPGMTLEWYINGLLYEDAPRHPEEDGLASFLYTEENGCFSVEVFVEDMSANRVSDSAEFVVYEQDADLLNYTWLTDADDDGWGSDEEGAVSISCEPEDDQIPYSETRDCDDENPDVFPGNADYCNDGLDSDCVPSTPSDCFPLGEQALTQAETVFYGLNDHYLGSSLAYAGDFNEDGYDDIVLGGYIRSKAFIVNGPAIGLKDMSSSSNYGCVLSTDSQQAQLSRAMTSGGDFNGDGKADLLLGAPGWQPQGLAAVGAAFLLFSQEPCGADKELNLDQHLADNLENNAIDTQLLHIKGLRGQDQLGFAQSFIPDLDGDGLLDIALGAYGDDDSATQAGAVYVLYSGDLAALPNSIDINDEAHLKILGDETFDKIGESIAGADLDGDGYGDIIIGSPTQQNNTGVVQVVYGRDIPVIPSVQYLTSLVELTLHGVSEQSKTGTYLKGTKDLDGDGDEEFFASAPGAENGAGVAYIIPGFYESAATYTMEDAFSSASPSAIGAVRFVGSASDNVNQIDFINDINGDGYQELMVGAPKYSVHSQNGGASYLLYGGPSFRSDWWESATGIPVGDIELETVGLEGTTAAQFIGDSNEARIGSSFASSGDFNGDGYNDVVVGSGHYHGEVHLFSGGGL
ncbi:MAG: MopE-related protein [Myxococcota bacterium]|nr:MopE-related protein [Myxococcota bacterium]